MVVINSNSLNSIDNQMALFSIEIDTDKLTFNNINNSSDKYLTSTNTLVNDNNLIEEFKDIKEYEGLYKISNFGDVFSSRSNKFLKQDYKSKGYNKVTLYYKSKGTSKYIHHLVAEMFLDIKTSQDKKNVIDHIDNNKHNNRVDNLQLITQRLNSSKDKYRYGKTSQFTGVHFNKKAGKFEAKIFINGCSHNLGTFGNEYYAHLEYQMALKYYNKNGNLNDYNFKIKRRVINISLIPDKNQVTINY